jgi:hypothetical protein
MARPLLVEILAYAPTAFYHCTHCEIVWEQTGFSRGVRAEQLQSGLPPDLTADYQAVSDWARGMFARHGEAVLLRVVDAASIEGFLLAARHRVRRFPAVIVDGRERFFGTSFEPVDRAIERRLAAVAAG